MLRKNKKKFNRNSFESSMSKKRSAGRLKSSRRKLERVKLLRRLPGRPKSVLNLRKNSKKKPKQNSQWSA